MARKADKNVESGTSKDDPDLREMLIAKIRSGSSTGACAAPVADEACRGRDAQVEKPKSAKEAFLESFRASGKQHLTATDITENIQKVLNGGAHKVPQSKASLEGVMHSLREVQVARKNADPLPAKMHRCVSQCLKDQDPVMVDLQLLALEADLDARLSRLREMARKADKNVESGTSKDDPDPVLVALGEKGRGRLMWEYHKTYVSKRPAYGVAARMSYKPGSYVGQLYEILSQHLGAESPKNLSSARALRDFLGSLTAAAHCEA